MKMERRDFLLWIGAIAFSLGLTKKEKWELFKVLFNIYREVKEMGCRAGEDFIKREFHLDLDGKRENREEHIVVLIHNEGNGDKFILQVTFFKTRANYYFTRNAENIFFFDTNLDAAGEIADFVDMTKILMKKHAIF